MNPISILFAFIYAIIMTSLLVTLFTGIKNWRSSWPLFVIILFGTLAAGIWVVPIGPVMWGYYILPGFIVALIFTLLLAAAMPKKNKKNEKENREKEEIQKNITPTTYYSPHAYDPQKGIYKGDDSPGSAIASGILWIIIVLLTFIIIIGSLIESAF